MKVFYHYGPSMTTSSLGDLKQMVPINEWPSGLPYSLCLHFTDNPDPTR